jgi:hypothetical protein
MSPNYSIVNMWIIMDGQSMSSYIISYKFISTFAQGSESYLTCYLYHISSFICTHTHTHVRACPGVFGGLCRQVPYAYVVWLYCRNRVPTVLICDWGRTLKAVSLIDRGGHFRGTSVDRYHVHTLYNYMATMNMAIVSIKEFTQINTKTKKYTASLSRELNERFK